MLVTMVFQTLYFLVDLYWVGHLGKEAVAGVGVAGNLTFIVLAVSQMLGVGTTTLVSHAAGQRNAERALLVFNQSQVLSTVVGLGVPGGLDGVPDRLRERAQRRLRHRRERGRLPALLPAGDEPAVRHGRDGLGAARRRELQARHGRADRDRHHQHRARAGADVRLGHGPADGRGGCGGRLAHRGGDWRRLALHLLLRPRGLPALRRTRHEAAVPALEGHAQDRTAGRRRVRDDGRLPDAGLRAGAAVRRRRASRLRHRHAGRYRPCSCRSWRWASRWRPWPARTSAHGSPCASRPCSRTRA